MGVLRIGARRNRGRLTKGGAEYLRRRKAQAWAALCGRSMQGGGRRARMAAALRRGGGVLLPWRVQIRPKAGGQEPKKRGFCGVCGGFCGYGGSVAAGYQKRGAKP